MLSYVTDVSPKTNKFNTAEPPRLFHNNTFNSAAVTEHWPYEPYIRDTALRTRVEHLLEQSQNFDAKLIQIALRIPQIYTADLTRRDYI